jgi:class 3 adenylate cyclase
MSCLSLRLAISAVVGVALVVTAAVTLTLIFAAGSNAVRGLGEKHVEVLLEEAEFPVQVVMNGAFQRLEMLQNATSEAFDDCPTPARSTRCYEDHISAHLQTHMDYADTVTFLGTHYADGTWIRAQHDAVLGTILTNVVPHRVTSREPSFSPQPSSRHNASLTMVLDVRVFEAKTGSRLSDPISDMRVPATFREPMENPWVAPDRWQSPLPTTWSLDGWHASAVRYVVMEYLTVSAPLVNRATGSLLGRCVTYASLSDLYERLLLMGRSQRTAAVVLDARGFLVASSASDIRVRTVVSPDKLEQAGPAQSAEFQCTEILRPDEMFRCIDPPPPISLHGETCKPHFRTFALSYLQHLDESDLLLADTSGRTRVRRVPNSDTVPEAYYAAVRRLSWAQLGQDRSSDLILVQFLVERDLLASIADARDFAIGLTCGVFVFSVAMSFTAIYFLLSPMHQLAARMERAASFEDHVPEHSTSAICEVRVLEDAFCDFADELQRLKSYVPQAILQQQQLKTPAISSPGSGAPAETSTVTTCIGPSSVALMPALRPTQVTVLAVNLSGFNTATLRARPGQVTRACAALMDFVSQEVLARRGVLASHHGDLIIATFNGTRPCSQHITAGTKTAMAICHDLPRMGQFALNARVGLCSGGCLIGPMGSACVKAYNTYGKPYHRACLYERLAKLYCPAGVLTDASTAEMAFMADTSLQADSAYAHLDIVAVPRNPVQGYRPASVAIPPRKSTVLTTIFRLTPLQDGFEESMSEYYTVPQNPSSHMAHRHEHRHHDGYPTSRSTPRQGDNGVFTLGPIAAASSTFVDAVRLELRNSCLLNLARSNLPAAEDALAEAGVPQHLLPSFSPAASVAAPARLHPTSSLLLPAVRDAIGLGAIAVATLRGHLLDNAPTLIADTFAPPAAKGPGAVIGTDLGLFFDMAWHGAQTGR